MTDVKSIEMQPLDHERKALKSLPKVDQKILELKEGRLLLYPDNFKSLCLSTLKIIVAPVSFALTATLTAIWLATRALWIIPPLGWVVDVLFCIPAALNEQIGTLTFEPLKRSSQLLHGFNRDHCCNDTLEDNNDKDRWMVNSRKTDFFARRIDTLRINLPKIFEAPPEEKKTSPQEPIDLGATCGAIVTNSILSITLSTKKLLAFTCLPALGGLLTDSYTKKLHEYNVDLSSRAIKPLHNWSLKLQEEHTKMTETCMIFGWKQTFNLAHYKEQAIDSFKTFMAPISLSLTTALGVGIIPVKLAYLCFIIPGLFADGIYVLPLWLNKKLGSLTHTSVSKLAEKVLKFHCDSSPVFQGDAP